MNTRKLYFPSWLCAFMIASLVLSSCTQKHRFFTDDLPDTNLTIVRFDSALLQSDTTAIGTSIQQLFADYPVFMPYYVENILGIMPEDTAYLAQALPQFLNDTLYGFRATNEQVRNTFADIDDIRKPLNLAFARLKTLYPTITLPTLYFFISGFNASILFLDETQIAVGTDMYLGSDYPYYNDVVYNYQKQTMRKECIPADVVSAYLFHYIPFASRENRLLDNMIYRGKIMYLLSLLFQEDEDAEIMGYTAEQMAWSKKYEKDIWNLMMDRRVLFDTNYRTLTAYLNDGPFCAEISQDCPARIATWIGWQICESYLKNNPDVTLQDLMIDTDAQRILALSMYKP